MITFSAVVPLFNKAAYVRRAVESMLEQTYPVDEVIVVDDCSTDGGAEVVEAILDPRVRVVRQANQGPGAARNEGARQASGEWIALLDADDWWEPFHLETLAGVIAKYRDVDVVGSAYRRWGPDGPGRHFKFVGDPGECWRGSGDDWFRAAVLGDPLFCSSSVAVRRMTWLEEGGFREDVWHGEDTDYWMRLMTRYRFAFSRRTTAYYWFPGDEVVTATTRRRGIEGFRSPHLTEWPSRYRQLGYWQAEFVAKRQLSLLNTLCREGFGREVRKRLGEVETKLQRRQKRMLWLKTWAPLTALLWGSRIKAALRRGKGSRA